MAKVIWKAYVLPSVLLLLAGYRNTSSYDWETELRLVIHKTKGIIDPVREGYAKDVQDELSNCQ